MVQNNTLDLQIESATNEALNSYEKTNGKIELLDVLSKDKARAIVNAVMEEVCNEIDFRNNSVPKGNKWVIPKNLPAYSLAGILNRTQAFKMVQLGVNDSLCLCVRTTFGEKKGIYQRISSDAKIGDQSILKKVVRCLAPGNDMKYFNEVVRYLQDLSDIVELTHNDNLVWCQNGVFDFSVRDNVMADTDTYSTPHVLTDAFTPYDSPEFLQKYGDEVVMVKLATKFNPDAKIVKIVADDGFEWDLNYHLSSPYSNEASKRLFIEQAHFAIRGISGGMVWFFVNGKEGSNGNASGRNGKNGQVNLITNLWGSNYINKTPIEDLEVPEKLWKLPEQVAIIADESNAGVHAVDKASTFKNIARQQPITIRRLYDNPIEYVFRGPFIQCINGDLKFKEQTDSVFGRVGVLRFEKYFVSNGVERSYINNDYIKRPEVLEMFLLMLLEMPCLTRYTPEYLAEIEDNRRFVRANSSHVFQFMEEYADKFTLTTIPKDLLWDIFQVYHNENHLHYEYDKRQFWKEVCQWVRQSDNYELADVVKLKQGSKEPLLLEFASFVGSSVKRDLADKWLSHSPMSFGANVNKNVLADIKEDKLVTHAFRGAIKRKDTVKTVAQKPDDYSSYFEYVYLLSRINELTGGTESELLSSKAFEPELIMTYDEWVLQNRPKFNISGTLLNNITYN